ncbi:hypothetical protein D9M69_695720 [compost metagenome]
MWIEPIQCGRRSEVFGEIQHHSDVLLFPIAADKSCFRLEARDAADTLLGHGFHVPFCDVAGKVAHLLAGQVDSASVAIMGVVRLRDDGGVQFMIVFVIAPSKGLLYLAQVDLIVRLTGYGNVEIT